MLKRKSAIIIGLVVILLAFIPMGCTTPVASSGEAAVFTNQQQGIWVNGQGRIAVVPDIAQLTLGVQAQEATVSAAQEAAATAMNKVVAALTGNSVANNDIQTQRFSIQMVTRYDDSLKREVITGYMVTNVVTAKIRALDKIGAIIDAAAVAGGNLTRIEGIVFSIEDPTPYYNQAREQAVKDAKARAEQIARLSGVSLGKPTFISESVSSPSPVPVKAVEQTPINPGSIGIVTTVQMVYAISD